MYNLAGNSSSTLNSTFNTYHSQLYKIFSAKNLLNLPPQSAMTIEDYKAIIQEISLNNLELRYQPVNTQWTADEMSLMSAFMKDYYH